jgi:hypothetical protein
LKPRTKRASKPAEVRRTAFWWPFAVVALVAALLTFWRLDAIYLWQDEANTAVLAARMLEHGRPLAYDGTNLLTNDNFAAEDRATIGERTTSAKAGLDYILQRGDLKSDTSWIFQPWGQFVAAGASIAVLGQTTLAARLPFALAGFATLVVLYFFARRALGDARVALLASALLTANAGWILHARQARYYALSALFLLVTFWMYERWQRGGRAGAPMFVAAAWLWFQIDYGTFWPVVGVLGLDALVFPRRGRGIAAATFAIVALGVAPFVLFYELAGRLSAQIGSFDARLADTIFNVNRHIVPVLVLGAAAAVFHRRRPDLSESERRVIGLCGASLIALTIWVPAVAPDAFLRYVVIAAPLGCLLTAWTLVALVGRWGSAVTWVAAAALWVTPWITLPFDGLMSIPQLRAAGGVIRPELRTMLAEVFVPRRDPNRAVVEWLRANVEPTDEILINYEDAPLMYYLPNPIRGGIAAFRAEDRSAGPPRFIVLRQSVVFVHWPVFVREMNRYALEPIAIDAPDVIWGNNPDPRGSIQDPGAARPLYLARVVGPGSAR